MGSQLSEEQGRVRLQHAIAAGSIAGMCSILVCHPFDTIRVRVQTNRNFIGPVQCFVQTVTNEGALALYKGLTLPLFAQAVYKAVMFGGYNYAYNLIRTHQHAFKKKEFQQELDLQLVFGCGAFAGMCNSFVVTPVELIRNRMMIQYHRVSLSGESGGKEPRTPVSYRTSLDGVRQVWKATGFFGMFRGLQITLQRDIVGVGLFYAANEGATRFFRSMFNNSGKQQQQQPAPTLVLPPQRSSNGSLGNDVLGRKGSSSNPSQSSSSASSSSSFSPPPQPQPQPPPPQQSQLAQALTSVASGAAAGFAYWTWAFPFDVIKTRVQTAGFSGTPALNAAAGSARYNGDSPWGVRRLPPNAGAIVRHLIATQGVEGFYKGFSVALLRGVPSATIIFTVYKSAFDWLSSSKRDSGPL